MTQYLLAELNIAFAKFPLEDPRIADFVNAIDDVNKASEGFKGFHWRYITEDESAESEILAPLKINEDYLLANMSVWQNLDDLKGFIFASPHIEIMKRRHEWFNRVSKITTVLWWMEASSPQIYPSLQEGVLRLQHLQAHGATPFAFTFHTQFSPTQH